MPIDRLFTYITDGTACGAFLYAVYALLRNDQDRIDFEIAKGLALGGLAGAAAWRGTL